MKTLALNKKSNLFKAIGHPSRVQILEFLSSGECCVCDIIFELGLEQSQSNVSQHLSVLRRENLIESRKQGMKVIYRIKHPEVLALLQKAQEIICNELDSNLRSVRGIEPADRL